MTTNLSSPEPLHLDDTSQPTTNANTNSNPPTVHFDENAQPPAGLSKKQLKKWRKNQAYQKKQREKELRRQQQLRDHLNRNESQNRINQSNLSNPIIDDAIVGSVGTNSNNIPIDTQSVQSISSTVHSHVSRSTVAVSVTNTNANTNTKTPPSASMKSKNKNKSSGSGSGSVSTQATMSKRRSKRETQETKSKHRKKILPQYDDPATRHRLRKQQIAHRVSVPNDKQIKMFAHLPQFEQELHISMKLSQNIHPSVIGLGIYYANGIIRGANGRCVTLFKALKDMISSYECPGDKTFSRELMKELNPCIQYLVDCRPQAIAMGNAIKVLKNFIRNLSPDMQASEVCPFWSHVYVYTI